MRTSEKKIKALESLIASRAKEDAWIICLQEVTLAFYALYKEKDVFSNHTYSLHFRERGVYEGKNRELGCLIVASGNVDITSSFLIDRALFPERALVAEMTAGDKSFQTICFHSLTGVGYKRAKSAHFAALVDYLHNRKGKPTVLCCDLNEPEVDHFQLDKNVYFSQYRGDKGDDPARILNPEGIHDLEDAFRIWLRQKGALSSEIKHRQESAEDIKNSPLAVSHKVGRIHSKRYDFIMVSPHFVVHSMQYDYEGGVENGSDHALLIGKFS
ncbi:MAG: hypothetical protein WBK97_06655 [Bacteroidales bacterium]|jgi:endonuclease/exonuclease/phosphatase family metal-dependent hydrolase